MESTSNIIIFSWDLSFFCHRPVLCDAQDTGLLLGVRRAPKGNEGEPVLISNFTLRRFRLFHKLSVSEKEFKKRKRLSEEVALNTSDHSKKGRSCLRTNKIYIYIYWR